ncbi:class F sortase [Streptomyces sp. NPDC051018]|uniref:class F sortase n=1 Tax=Streptomyces sp. NPDC051018 TaxID=3365639 RepID=UPI0037AEF14E
MIRAPLRTALALLLALTAAGCSSSTAPERPSRDGASAASVPTAPDAAPGRPSGPATAAPVRVTIPAIGVDSSLMRLGLNGDGTVEVPPAEQGMSAGWYTGAAVPGEPGAAVIIGHNDTKYGRAVFHDLRKLTKGAEISVINAAGVTARFTVTGKEVVQKTAFPTQRVYGRVDDRVLRLVTCDGPFDPQGHPVDNLIVYATAK